MVAMKNSSKIKSVITQEQVKALLRMAYSHKDNISVLKDKLEEYKAPENKIFKPESIEIALEYMEKNPSRFSRKLYEVISSLLNNKDITMRRNKESLEGETSPMIAQEDYKTVSEYRKANKTTPENLDLFMKRAIDDNDINEIISLNSLNKSLGRGRIMVESSSPLEYALKLRKNDLALKMMQAGFVINHRSKVEQSSINDAIQNIIQRRAGRNVVQEILNGKVTDKALIRSR
ncbi:MAG: hypothetical protein N4A31_05055 [Rickettsiales bacterium]|jgi:predicted nucleic-acid-binding protein|nr:hypothetical protein [Rickettsiales bacterium]